LLLGWAESPDSANSKAAAHAPMSWDDLNVSIGII